MRFQAFAALMALALVVAGCGDDEELVRDAATGDGDGDGDISTQLPDAIANYADIVHATYVDSLAKAEELQAAVDDLIADPSEETLMVARNVWLDAREPYLLTETYRFYDGPIDNAEDGPEGLINAWPLDENYIDYVEDDASAGIINDPSEAIDAESLLALNGVGSDANVATGFHAIEFLLWGQDLSADGPGDRPYTDFVDGGTADNQDRRRAYLKVVTDLLVEHLEGLVAAWAPDDEDNYRAELLEAAPKEALRRILTGMTILSGFETGGERLQTAYDTADQNDEHSCFSDNTHRDMVQDVRGIQNVYLGTYRTLDGERVDGPSIRAVIAATDDALATRLAMRIQESVDLAEDLVPPFDNEIALDNEDGRARVLELIDSLNEQESDLLDVFELFELDIEIPE
jgi:putative iron-regulated protein